MVTLEGPTTFEVCAGLLALIERRAITVPLNRVPDAKRAEFLDVAEVEVVVDVAEDDVGTTTRTGRRADHELYLRAGGRPAGPGPVQPRYHWAQQGGRAQLRQGPRPLRRARAPDADPVVSQPGPHRQHQHPAAQLSQGSTVVTVADRTPDAVLGTVAQHRVQVPPTTPTFLNLLLISGALDRHDTSALKLITEPMRPRTLKRLRAALPDVRLKQTYGLSELGILPTRSKRDDTLWITLGTNGFQHKIVDNELWIKSDMAMLGYLNSPATFDDEGFFNTQDVVDVDGEYIRVLALALSDVRSVDGLVRV